MTARRPYLIGIAGPSGAGKTTLAREVAGRLGAPILSLDCYYREMDGMTLAERAQVNFDEPSALDYGLLLAQITQLSRGMDVAVPVYDFSRHTRAPQATILPAGPFVIVEGLFALHWREIRALMGTRVFVTAKDLICFERRLERDIKERGRTPASVVSQYQQTVRPMAERYVIPTHVFADLVVSGMDRLEHSCRLVLDHVEKARAPLAAICRASRPAGK